MPFERLLYETDMAVTPTVQTYRMFAFVDDRIVDIAPSELNARNRVATAGTELPLTVFSTFNLDKAGLYCRGVACRQLVPGTGGELTGSRLFVPIFRANTYRRWHIGYNLSIDGIPYIITGKRPELIRS